MTEPEPAAVMPPPPPTLSEAARAQLAALAATAGQAAPADAPQMRVFADQIQTLIGAE
jgi:hypothetical protein